MHLIELELIGNICPINKVKFTVQAACWLHQNHQTLSLCADSPANPNEGLIEGAGMLSSYVNRNVSSAKSIPLLLKNI
jgi:hypothetical protein